MSALIWCPFPDRESAERIADLLLDEGLIACANLIGEVYSRFVWKGAKDSAEEIGVLFKTHSGMLTVTVQRIESLHPYETPAILGWHCEVTGSATQAWLGELSGGKD